MSKRTSRILPGSFTRHEIPDHLADNSCREMAVWYVKSAQMGFAQPALKEFDLTVLVLYSG